MNTITPITSQKQALKNNKKLEVKKMSTPQKAVSFGLRRPSFAEIAGREIGISSLNVDNQEVVDLLGRALSRIRKKFSKGVILPDNISMALMPYSPGVSNVHYNPTTDSVNAGVILSKRFFEHPEDSAANFLLKMPDVAMAKGPKILLSSRVFPRSIFFNPMPYWNNKEIKPTISERLRLSQNIYSLYSGYVFAQKYPKEVLKETFRTPQMQNLKNTMQNAPKYSEIKEIPENRQYEYLEMLRELYFDGNFPFCAPVRDEFTPINVIIGGLNYLGNVMKKNPNKFENVRKENNILLASSDKARAEAAKLSTYASVAVEYFVGYAFDNIVKGIGLSNYAKKLLQRFRMGNILND